jgi:hypothetical protein
VIVSKPTPRRQGRSTFLRSLGSGLIQIQNLSLQVYAISPDGLIDWGTTDVAVFTATPSSRIGAGFTCLYDFGFAETRLQGMIVKGLIVLAQFHSFKDDSRRVDYFVREYFALAHGRY